MQCFVDHCLSFYLFSVAIVFSDRRFTDSGCPFDIFTLFLYIVEHVLFLDMYKLFATGRQETSKQSINQSIKQDDS